MKVDVDELADVVAFCEVYAVPAFYCYKDGVFIECFVGSNIQKIEAFIKRHCITA